MQDKVCIRRSRNAARLATVTTISSPLPTCHHAESTTQNVSNVRSMQHSSVISVNRNETGNIRQRKNNESINENENWNVKIRQNGNAMKIVKYEKRKCKNKKWNEKVSKSFRLSDWSGLDAPSRCHRIGCHI